MPTIVVTLPADNTTADVGDYNVVIQAMLAIINGYLDDSNIASLSGTKITAGTIPSTAFSATANQGWITNSTSLSAITCLGNRSYSMATSTDQSGVLSPGMRVRFARSVAAPTKCTTLNGSTQYYSNTGNAGLTFTDDFVVSAWVKLTSYGVSAIMSRLDGTSGWLLDLQSTGQVRLAGFNANVANTSYVQSVQSLPLNKWVHISAQLDMSSFTASTTTSYVMIDGVDVPCTVARAGTNPTALVQAGNLNVGAYNGGTEPFPGRIAQAAVFSAKVAQATMRTYMSQGLAGTETSLISAYSFNNSTNDLNTSNANNLTANGSAVATTADSPFTLDASNVPGGTYDFGLITSVSSSSLTVQVPEGCAIPTSGGISAFTYSVQAAPFGFPSESNRWTLQSLLRIATSVTSNATFGSFLSGGYKLNIPIGRWRVGHLAGAVYNTTTTQVFFNLSSTALTGLTAAQGTLASPYQTGIVSPSAALVVISYNVRGNESLSSATDFVMYTVGATTSAGVAGDVGIAYIFAENAYL